MASRLGKHLLRANSKHENFQSICSLSLLFFICFLSVPWLTFSNYWGNSLTHLMLVTAFGLSVFGPKMTRSGWVYISNWAPRRLWSKWHNSLSHSPQVAGNTLPRLAPRFSRMWKFPQYPKSYSLTLWWRLGLDNTSLNAKSNVQNFSFCWSVKSII